MVIAYDEETVTRYMKEAVEYSQDRPVLIDHFLEDAIEVDVDALSDGEDVVIGGIMQHIEEAGYPLGRFKLRTPSGRYSKTSVGPDARLHLQTGTRTKSNWPDEHPVSPSPRAGTINDDGKVYVIEVNPRASRTVPYVSKATGVPMAKIASRLMTGRKLREFLPEIHRAEERSRHWTLLLREVSRLPLE
jgi:carbamoyl-phosphate synthase large subunit